VLRALYGRHRKSGELVGRSYWGALASHSR
jgi:hypothetical protein